MRIVLAFLKYRSLLNFWITQTLLSLASFSLKASLLFRKSFRNSFLFEKLLSMLNPFHVVDAFLNQLFCADVLAVEDRAFHLRDGELGLLLRLFKRFSLSHKGHGAAS